MLVTYKDFAIDPLDIATIVKENNNEIVFHCKVSSTVRLTLDSEVDRDTFFDAVQIAIENK